MASTSDNDFRYFLHRILYSHTVGLGIPHEIMVPFFENSQSAEADVKLFEKFWDALWFKMKTATIVWWNFMTNYAPHVFASRESYLTSVLSMLYFTNGIEDYYERFTYSMATVIAMAGFCYSKGPGKFAHFTAALLMCLFKKKLERGFFSNGGWHGLKLYASSPDYLGYVTNINPNRDIRRIIQCNSSVEALAKMHPDYHRFRNITYDELVSHRDVELLVNEVVICYIDVIRPYLKVGAEEERPQDMDTGLAESSSEQHEAAESSELRSAPTLPRRSIQKQLLMASFAKSSGNLERAEAPAIRRALKRKLE